MCLFALIYQGISFEHAKEVRKTYLNPALFSYYKERLMGILNIDVELPLQVAPEAAQEFKVTVFDLKQHFQEKAFGSTGSTEMKVRIAEGFGSITFDMLF